MPDQSTTSSPNDEQEKARKKLAVFISLSGAGGVEKMVMNLVREFSRYELDIDFITLRANSEHFTHVPDCVNLRPLKARHSISCVPELARYLRDQKPDALLVAKDRAGRAAIAARKIAGSETRVVLRLGTNLSRALKQRSRFNRWLRLRQIKRSYRHLNAIVAVSEGVAKDVHATSQYPVKKIQVIRNPVISPELIAANRKASPDHPWLIDKAIPVVIGAGRLTLQKDFATLIEAVGIINQSLPCRLIILGDGKLRSTLSAQIHQSKLDHLVDMPGFKKNLYAWISRASVFALSSRWEGSPNVLTEALALGVPAVSTRCPSGPDEILQNGKFGTLVEVGDAHGLARAIQGTLREPPKPQILKDAVSEYNVEYAASRYLETLKILPQRKPDAVVA